MRRPTAIACVLAVVASLAAWRLATYALDFNEELAIGTPALASVPPVIEDPKTPRLARRVYLIVVDGLRLDDSFTPALNKLREKGTGLVAATHYPSISRPGYITILTGVPAIPSGVRVNRVSTPVKLDSIMARAKAAGLRVGTASDIGMVPPLFASSGSTSSGQHPQTGDLVTPKAGVTWPFDEVRRGDSVAELATSLATVIAGTNNDFVFVLAGDVDRAGHKSGGDSDLYRDAAKAIDAMIGGLPLDLARDAIIVTADHGHTDRGGHGGREPEVRAVPLIVAGAGVVPGARTVDAMLADIAPTVCALLGLPAPGHAHGRTLVELLALDRTAVDARIAADARRLAVMRDAPRDEAGGPHVLGFVVIAGIAVGAVIAMTMVRDIQISRASLIGGVAFVIVIAGLFVICRGQLSPSHVPALNRLQRWMAIFAVAGIGAQVWLALRALRGEASRLRAANGIALAGLVIALVPAFSTRAWFAPPYAEPPEPAWFVGIPGVEMAAAVTSIAIALLLVIEIYRESRSRRVASPSPTGDG